VASPRTYSNFEKTNESSLISDPFVPLEFSTLGWNKNKNIIELRKPLLQRRTINTTTFH